MMASSQVQIAFGRDSCFENNLKNLVTSCIPNDNIELTDLWVHHPQWQSSSPSTRCNDNTKWARAREIVFPVDRRSSSGGVSSLVQKWRGFEAEAKCTGGGNNNNNNNNNNKSNSAATIFLQDKDDNNEPPPRAHDDDSLGDWESDDRTGLSGRGRDSDATERERLRVADIIRKLTDNEVGSDHSPPPRIRTSWDQSQSEQRSLSLSPVVGGSPRIRGRQAYIDLLMQMERDRRKELEGLVGRKAVSKFSHRGRIQALLRIRVLRRGMEAKEGRHSSSDSHKAIQSALAHFRERADPSAQNGRKGLTDNAPAPAAPNLYAPNPIGKEDKHQEEVTNSKSCLRVEDDRIRDSEDSITSKQLDIQHTCLEANQDIQQNANVSSSFEHLQHEASPFQTFVQQESNWEGSNHSLAKSAEPARNLQHKTEINSGETAKSPQTNKINELNKEDEATNNQVTETNYDLTGDSANPRSFQSTSSNQQHIVETDTYWVSDVSHPEVGWEELHSDYEKKSVSNNKEWINEVSRPRSDWEDLRQARYEEMLDPFLDNEEIRVLLGRKSVSTFLSSGMKEKIDQVMICRSQGQPSLESNVTQAEKHKQLPEQGQEVVSEKGEGEDGEDEQDEGGGNYGDYFDEFEEAESSLGQQYNESDEYMDHIMTPSPPATWPQNQAGHESSDYSYQVASPSTQQSLSNYYSQDNGPNSSYGAHPAIEMELIYDLRRHMEQLHQEMSELRKSIKCCTDMQIKLQRSIKKEVATALAHPDAKNGRRNPVKKATSGGKCCVCCKVQVDCVLYRCGHMCTCFNCAHEVQWSSGKCPICRAPIVDVVRTYSNY